MRTTFLYSPYTVSSTWLAMVHPQHLWKHGQPSWPIYVISQVYIDGTGAGRSYLDATGAKEYDGTNTSGDDGEIKNFDSVLAALGISERMKKSDVPVPTWFIGYNENDYSITYWKKQANDAIATTEAGVYRQSIKSTALQTEYANATLR